MKRPLLLALAAIRPGESDLSYELAPAELGLEECEVAENPLFQRLLGDIRVQFHLVRDGVRLMLAGRVSFQARLNCAICGKVCELAFDEPVAAEYLDTESDAALERALSSDDMDRMLYDGDRIDLARLVHDAIHLAVPIAPVCRADCLGRCSRCGADLNLGPCSCPTSDD